jgi:ferredoxin-NADP reductase
LNLHPEVIIKNIISETPDSKTFGLEPVFPWQPVYKAGQFITFIFTHHGEEVRRSYSFSSSPEAGEPMRITVKRVDNGSYSRWLLAHAYTGMSLLTSGISGRFVLPEVNELSHLFFLAAGSGITPIFSLIKTALLTTGQTITLIYSNRSQRDTIFYNQLNELQKQYPQRLRIEFLFSDSGDFRHSRLSKWLLLALLERFQVPLTQTLFYTCGPETYMLFSSIVLVGAGVPKDHIKRENFDSRKPAFVPVPPDQDEHLVTLAGRDALFQLKVRYPDTILAAAKKRHIHLPYSCETGRCGSCLARCTEGKVWMARNEVLTDEEVKKGLLLTCQAYPVDGDVRIEV